MAQRDVERFSALFRGLERAYGEYVMRPGTKPDANGKRKGRALTRRAAITESCIIEHLAGDMSIGVIPVTDEGQCWFGALDIDIYDTDLQSVIAACAPTPFVPCRTKSGGLHLYVFFRLPVSAAQCRVELSKAAVALGYSGAEVFPKQDKLEPGALGSWINLPYFNASATERYAYDALGDALSLEQFLDLAEAKAMLPGRVSWVGSCFTPEAGNNTAWELDADPKKEDTPDILKLLPTEGPPCLARIVEQGLDYGERNKALFALALFFKKAMGSNRGLAKTLLQWNSTLLDKMSLPVHEVRTIAKSAARLAYRYPCGDVPLKNFCDRALCRARKHGIGKDGEPIIGALVRVETSPPQFFVEVGEKRLGPFGSKDFFLQQTFRRLALERGVYLAPMSMAEWESVLANWAENMRIETVPEDADADGRMFQLLREYVRGASVTETQEELLLFGRVWLRSDETGATQFFRLAGFHDFLRQRGFTEFRLSDLASRLQARGVQHEALEIKGERVECYRVSIGASPMVGGRVSGTANY